MPYSANDARDLMISSVLCEDPVLYIDDRWLYDQEDSHDIKILDLNNVIKKLSEGDDIK